MSEIFLVVADYGPEGLVVKGIKDNRKDAVQQASRLMDFMVGTRVFVSRIDVGQEVSFNDTLASFAIWG